MLISKAENFYNYKISVGKISTVFAKIHPYLAHHFILNFKKLEKSPDEPR